MKLKIGEREIGDGCAPYIIAEVGSNWRDLSDCLISITKAKQSGADAVKFQLFTDRDLFGFDRPDHTDFKFNLDPNWLPGLKEKADAVGIDFMCTAFSPEGYEMVDPFVKAHKVASAECTHLRILQKVRQLGKPVILSTGAKGADDIKMSLGALKSNRLGECIDYELFNREAYPSIDVVLMYCVAAYPASEVNLGCIETLRSEFRTLVGYSDHSTDALTIPVASIRNGACVLEKHFTAIEAITPDHGHSLDAGSFRNMVRAIRGEVSSSITPMQSEKPMVLRHNRRIIAIDSIHPGDTLTEGVNFGIYRSLKDDTRAAHPFMIDRLNGREAKRYICKGEGIWLDDVED